MSPPRAVSFGFSLIATALVSEADVLMSAFGKEQEAGSSATSHPDSAPAAVDSPAVDLPVVDSPVADSPAADSPAFAAVAHDKASPSRNT